MPIYEYKCENCNSIFEEFQNANDKPLTKCKKCGGKLKKIFSPAGIIFKGSGFHITDYVRKDKSEKNQKQQDTKQESNSHKKSST